MKTHTLAALLTCFSLPSHPLLHSLETEPGTWMIPNSFQEVRWHPIRFVDEMRQISAKLPGELQPSINTQQKCLYHSIHRDAHYAIHFNPSALFTPPDTLEEFMTRFNSIKRAEVIALEPRQPHVSYLLQINFFDEAEINIQVICRVYATDNTLYFALVEGGDFLLADEFFHSIQFEK